MHYRSLKKTSAVLFFTCTVWMQVASALVLSESQAPGFTEFVGITGGERRRGP